MMGKRLSGLLLALLLTVSMAVPGAKAASFSDAEQIDSAYESSIDFCVENGYLSAYMTGAFNPNGVLTRGAMAKLTASAMLGPDLARMLACQEDPFSDVKAQDTFAGYIAFCAGEGLVPGYTDGTFRPSASAELGSFLQAMLTAINYGTPALYWGENWDLHVMKAARDSGLLPPNAFSVRQPLTRADAAWVLHKAMLKASEAAPAPQPTVPEQPPQLPFTDAVMVDPVYAPGVAYCTGAGILSGYSSGAFNPKGQLTRGAAAKILSNMTEVTTRVGSEAPYLDVPAGHTFAGYIQFCAERQLISGYADGTFRPAGPLTTVAFTKMLLNQMGYTRDAARYQGSGWKDRVWADAQACGMVTAESRFTPESPVTREQAAWMVYYAKTWKS